VTGANPVKKVARVSDAVRVALDNPIGVPRIEKTVRAGNKICIICDDVTRMTPAREILAELLPRLHGAGVAKSDIFIVMALGSHRKMTDAELEQKVGKNVFADYRVLNSEFRDADKLAQAGTSQLGTPIKVLKEALTADIRIGVGTIAPHGCMGWSGGAKILYPGITSEDIVSEFHAMQGLEDEILFGRAECPVRLAVERWTEKIGLDFIINTVLTEDADVYSVVAGHFVKAHRVGVGYGLDVCGVKIETEPDVVLISSKPLEADFWQCGKALYGAAKVARHGGSLLLLAPCHEGIGPHENIIAYTRTPNGAETLKKRIEAGDTGEDLLTMSVGVSMGKINANFHVAVVSDGLTEEQLSPGGYEWFPESSLQAALDRALDRYENPRLLVITAGGETVPFITGR
jgi:nickel-dependent lactate racemase